MNGTGRASIDPAEVAYYTRLAHTWWDATGPFWPLHRLNGLRLDFIRHHVCRAFDRNDGVQRPFQGLRILDVGCGGGILSEAVAGLGADVHAIDVVERNIAVAQAHARDPATLHSGPAVRYEQVTAEALVERGERYDVVLSMEVVEHVAGLAGFMQACCELVAPRGLLFVATINRTLRSYLFAIIGAEYVLRWLPRGTHQWRRFPKPAELEQLMRRAGLDVTARRGVKVNPLTRRFSLSPDLAVNYMLVGRNAHSAR